MSVGASSGSDHHASSREVDAVAQDRSRLPRREAFRLSPIGWLAVAVLAFWAIIVAIGPQIAPYGENDLPFPDDYSEYQSPRSGALLGTDVQDRDVLSRIIYGARNTLGVSLIASVLAYLIGVSAGMLAAVSGRWIDGMLSRLNDALLSLPKIMLGLVIVAAFEPSRTVLVLVAAAVYAPIVFRLARALSMEIAVTDYVKVAQLRGEGPAWIIFREIWFNVTMPLLSDFGLRTIYIILFISSLSFLGLGIQPPHADWGLMVRENLAALQYGASVWAPLAPALAIASVTISINLIVDELSVQSGGKLLKQT